MAIVLGVNAALLSGATDISAYLTELDFKRKVDTKESSVFGTLDKTYVAAQREVDVTAKGFFDKGSTAADKLAYDGSISGATIALKYYPESKSAGASNIEYSGSGFVTAHDVGSKFNDLVSVSITYKISGAWVRAAIA